MVDDGGHISFCFWIPSALHAHSVQQMSEGEPGQKRAIDDSLHSSLTVSMTVTGNLPSIRHKRQWVHACRMTERTNVWTQGEMSEFLNLYKVTTTR